MEGSRRILRRSVHAFLQDYQAFTSTATLVFPVAASTLLSRALTPPSSPVLSPVRSRLGGLFAAAGFPASSGLFSYLHLKLSQTALSSALTAPFVLTFLVLARASVIQFVLGRCEGDPPPLPRSLLRLYHPLLRTHLCNALVMLAANAAAFAVLSVAFNVAAEGTILFLSVAGSVAYSVVLAHALVACNMAVVISGVERCGGFLPILKACLLLRGRAATALVLALPTNLSMAAAEALFQARVVNPYHGTAARGWSPLAAWEGIVIAYIYSLLIVLDIIVGCMFFKSCKQQACSPDRAVDCGQAAVAKMIIWAEEDDAADASEALGLKLQDLPLGSV